MAFSIFRLGRSSVSAAFERGAIAGVVSASAPVAEAPNKGNWKDGRHSQRASYGILASASRNLLGKHNMRTYPVSVSERCTGDSCPIDITRLRRNSSSSTISERSLSTSAPASYRSFVRRYSKSSDTEADSEKKKKLKAEKEEKKKQEKKQEVDSDSDSDSDSDHEQRSKGYDRSNFWRRKMRTFHSIIDVNKDGVIAYDDFQLLAQRFIDLGHLDEEQSEELKDIVRLTWEEQWGEITPYNLITVEQYLADMTHVVTDKELKHRAGKFLPYLFRAVDRDHSGFISVNEFKLFFECLGLSSESAALAFAVIDKNGDGKLSLKEFVKLGNDFFFTEDESRVSKMFWGPLAP